MKRRLLLPLPAALLLLAACKDASQPATGGGTAAAPKATPVSIDAIVAEAKGFSVGSTMAARVAYVFFDPQCPHCAALWLAAKPLRTQARFVWIPVSLLNPTSTVQGAALLAAADPVAAMDQHEASLSARAGGITGGTPTDAQKETIRKNTELMNRFGFASVPTVVARHAQTGEVVTIEGSAPTPVLAQKLGLQAS